MSVPDEPTRSHDDPLDAVIAAYVQQVEAGAVPDREALLAAHPDLADRLRAFFADYDRLDLRAGDLRLSDDPNRTADRPEEPHELPRVRYFGDYELLEVIARGGMGVVYKARQVSLNRLVALKMIVHGQLATPRDVARFRAEAEAAANLDHPHIVPIYEVGEHDGRQYYAMRFIEGTSLARHPRADVRTDARLIATVARAVHFAHQRGLLHRDIKPSNILLDPAGVPFVADFGLAKRLDASGRDLTVTGEAVGTPRYMAPEQAAGRKDLTVAADVYSLGVVLYERLTGTPPFTGDNVLEVLRQVREADPPRPSSVRPGLDLDVETVCLKCLEKEPGKRYSSAEALADDLDRWLRGEPILARPVGQLGRFSRWCRRYPAVAGLAGAVAVTLLAGTAISTWFAVQADRRAAAEWKERRRAEAAEDDLEGTLARSLLRPFDRTGGEMQLGELEALWELAESVNDRLKLRFVAEAVRTPLTASQFRARMWPAWIAAVGLDTDRRARAERLLAPRLKDPGLGLPDKAEIAFASLELSEPESPTSREAAEVIFQALADHRISAAYLETWSVVLPLTSERMVPGDAVRVLTRALEGTHALDRQNEGYVRYPLVKGLTAAAARLGPTEAAKVLIQALEKEMAKVTYATAGRLIAEGLSVVAEQMEPAEAARVCTHAAHTLARAMEEANSHDAGHLATGLTAVAAWMDPAEAHGVCARPALLLSRALAKQSDTTHRHNMAMDLSHLVKRIGPAEADQVVSPVVASLTQALGKETAPRARESSASCLAIVARSMEPAKAAQSLLGALEKETNASAQSSFAKGLADVAGHLGKVEAGRVCAQATDLLTRAVKNAPDASARTPLLEALAAVARRLNPADADHVVRMLVESLEMRSAALERAEMAKALAVAARRVERLRAAQVCSRAAEILTQSLESDLSDFARKRIAEGLAALAPSLEPAEAARVCRRVIRMQTQATGEVPVPEEEDIIAAVVNHLDANLGTRIASHYARLITADTKSDWELSDVRPSRLMAVLTDVSRSQVRQRAEAIAAAVATTHGGLTAAFLLLPAAAEPFPCRLTTQELVDLLKYPTCVGEVRKVILKQLGNRYGRHFADHWQFVRFAQQDGLDLDFTTPPKRPPKTLPTLIE